MKLLSCKVPAASSSCPFGCICSVCEWHNAQESIAAYCVRMGHRNGAADPFFYLVISVQSESIGRCAQLWADVSAAWTLEFAGVSRNANRFKPAGFTSNNQYGRIHCKVYCRVRVCVCMFRPVHRFIYTGPLQGRGCQTVGELREEQELSFQANSGP